MKQHNPLERMVTYYQKEMQYLLERGRQFTTQYPKVAQRLDFHSAGSDDPHVQRLLESFAFLTARLQFEIDDRFSLFTTSLLGSLYPQFINPIPSSTIVELASSLDMGRQLAGTQIPAKTILTATAEEGQMCRFQTTMDTTLWPLEVTDVSCTRAQLYDIPASMLHSPWVLKIQIKPTVGTLQEYPFNKLCFHLAGDILTRYLLFEWIFTYDPVINTPIFVKTGDKPPVLLPKTALKRVGFEEEEALIPSAPQMHQAYRLLLEYFTFPQKFLFFEIQDLPPCTGNAVDILIPLGEKALPERVSLSHHHIRLGCVPATNLFFKTSEPIRLDHRTLEYRLVADHRQEKTTEIHSLIKVSATVEPSSDHHVYAPYFSYNHAMQEAKNPCFWIARRAPSHREDFAGTDLFLSFVDHALNPQLPAEKTIYAHTLCTNRALAEAIPAGALLEIQGALTGVRAKTLERPTPEIIPPLEGDAQWRLISHLSLNHMGFCAQTQSVEPLQELLRLYSFMDQGVHNEAEALLSLTHRQTIGRTRLNAWRGFAPQLCIALTVDESRPNAQGLFLLGMILDELFRLSANFNTLIETTLISHRHQSVWKQWPSRHAKQPAL